MNNAPPPQNRNPKSEIRNPVAKRIVTYILALILLVLLVMVILQSLENRRLAAHIQAPPPVLPPEHTYDQLTPRGLDLERIMSDPAAAGQSLPPGTTALDHDPADLPAPPNSDILLRYQTADAATAEQVCIRIIPDTTIESAASFYRNALNAGRWSFDESSPAPLVLRFASASPDRSLMVRLRQAGSQVRLVIQLRYTIHSGS